MQSFVTHSESEGGIKTISKVYFSSYGKKKKESISAGASHFGGSKKSWFLVKGMFVCFLLSGSITMSLPLLFAAMGGSRPNKAPTLQSKICAHMKGEGWEAINC